MSSHHIVREKQEPALLVLGLDTFPYELLGQLLEWSPTVITTPQTAEKLVAYGIKIDWVITDDINYTLQSDVKLMRAGNSNMIATALEYLSGNGYAAVNIVTDELILKDCAAFAGRIDLVIFNSNKKIYAVNPGFSKWKPAGETIALLTPAGGLEFSGLEKIKDQLYQTTADGFFTLNFNSPFIFIAEEI